jgi:hypothetical protein
MFLTLFLNIAKLLFDPLDFLLNVLAPNFIVLTCSYWFEIEKENYSKMMRKEKVVY